MIVSIDELMEMPEFTGKSEKALKKKLNAVEHLLSGHTPTTISRTVL